MELLYVLFQTCEISLFSLLNVAVWRDWLITFHPQHYEHDLQEDFTYNSNSNRSTSPEILFVAHVPR